MHFQFFCDTNEFSVFHDDVLPWDSYDLHRHADFFFRCLLASDRPPVIHLPGDGNSLKVYDSLTYHFHELFDCLCILESANSLLTNDSIETRVLYEYHPYIELMLEFLLRRQGYTIFEKNSAHASVERFNRFRRTRSEDNIFSIDFLPVVAGRTLYPLKNLLSPRLIKFVVLPLSRKEKLPPVEVMKNIASLQSLLNGLRAFILSKDAKRYLDLREKTYTRVFEKTVQYGASIVERYRHCCMVMTELRFAGDRWDDVGIRDCANKVGELFHKLFPKVRKHGILGHAWRLDTVLAKSDQSHMAKTLWRVRWLTFVRAGESGPVLSGDRIAGLLQEEAEQFLAGMSSTPTCISSVCKEMTSLYVDPLIATSSTVSIADYRQQIESWAFELSIGEIYHRVRVLEGGRPRMCGRGHPSDGCAK